MQMHREQQMPEVVALPFSEHQHKQPSKQGHQKKNGKGYVTQNSLVKLIFRNSRQIFDKPPLQGCFLPR